VLSRRVFFLFGYFFFFFDHNCGKMDFKNI